MKEKKIRERKIYLTYKDTLLHYEVPQIIVTTDQSGQYYLCVLFNSERNCCKYLCHFITEEMYLDLKDKKIDIRDALNSGTLLYLVVKNGENIKRLEAGILNFVSNEGKKKKKVLKSVLTDCK